MQKNVLYFVDDISTSFVYNDISKFSKEFDQVILFSINKIIDRKNLPANIKIIDEFLDWKRYKKFNILFNNLYDILKIYFKECVQTKKLLSFRKSVALLSSNIFKANEILRHISINNLKIDKHTLFYSFWFYDCIYIAWLKTILKNIRTVSRAHSGDLYENHISIKNQIHFRYFILNYLDNVYPVSKMGTIYLKTKYPRYIDKVEAALLGTKDYNVENPFNKNQFVVVSCASFRHHKRIHKIAQMILLMKINVKWLHFGHENLTSKDPKIEEYKKYKNLISHKSNIEYVSMGYYSNEMLMNFYSKTPINLFISLSAAEGIPVSMMEAISFGIPVLSTDVGGCNEIVNDNTGILIPYSTDMQSVCNLITEFKDSHKNTQEFRIKVREFWKQNFDADKNYRKFFDSLNRI